MTPDNEQLYLRQQRSLRVVLVLSMIGSGVMFFIYMLYGLMLPSMRTLYYSGSLSFPAEMTTYIEQILDTPRSFFLCGTILYGMSLAGVIIMWKLRKSGFHLYAMAQLLILLVTLLFLGRDHISLGDIMLTILFIAYYFIAFRALARYAPETEPEPATENSLTSNPSDNNSPSENPQS